MAENKIAKPFQEKYINNMVLKHDNEIKLFQESFLDELVKQAGFEENEFDMIKDDLRPILQERIVLHIYRELSEEDWNKVSDFLEHEKYEELNAFLKEKIPNYEDFIMEIYAEFEDEYLENFEDL